MRYKLIDDRIIKYGSSKYYDVHHEGDLINLVNDLNEFKSEEIKLRSKLYNQEVKISHYKLMNDLLKREIWSSKNEEDDKK